MPGTPHPLAARWAAWPRELHRAALLLGIAGGLYWASFGLGREVLPVPYVGRVYADLLLAWAAVLLQVAAWPHLAAGLRDLRARRPREANPVLAARAFGLSLALVLGAALALPLEYLMYGTGEAWLPLLLVSTFPYLPWTFVPVLVLHGVLFGRVANYLDPAARRISDAGVLVLFAVAAATVAIVLGHPGATAYVDSWSAGRGILPAAAFLGYALIAIGLTWHVVPVGSRVVARSLEGLR
ncbi:MAG TPA: hypothetical protein VJ326_09380 [Thermoplasmata archaeon]|nr:hypothetical protein [Thermoplasmata archaeon]